MTHTPPWIPWTSHRYGHVLKKKLNYFCHLQTEKKTAWINFGVLVGGWTNPFEKHARQIWSCPQVFVKTKNIWNHQLEFWCLGQFCFFCHKTSLRHISTESWWNLLTLKLPMMKQEYISRWEYSVVVVVNYPCISKKHGISQGLGIISTSDQGLKQKAKHIWSFTT